MLGLLRLIQKSKEFLGIQSVLLRTKELDITVIDEAKSVLLAAVHSSLRKRVLVICATSEEVNYLIEGLQLFAGPTCQTYSFPENDSSSFDRAETDLRAKQLRLKAIAALVSSNPEEPSIYVASIQAILQKTIDPKSYFQHRQMIKVGEYQEIKALTVMLISSGYQFETIAETPGSLTTRGSIIDIYPPEYEFPLRIELWDDKIETIRQFDPITQKSTGVLYAEISVGPAEDTLLYSNNQENVATLLNAVDFSRCDRSTTDQIKTDLADIQSGAYTRDRLPYAGFFCFSTLLDYFKEDVIAFDDYSKIKLKAADIIEHHSTYVQRKEIERQRPKQFPSPYYTWDLLNLSSERFLYRIDLKDSLLKRRSRYLPFDPINPTVTYETTDWLDSLTEPILNNQYVIIMSAYPDRIRQMLNDIDISCSFIDDDINIDSEQRIFVCSAFLSRGWKYSSNDIAITVLTDTEIFGTRKLVKAGSSKTKGRRVSISELVTGCFVVHVEHGIGRFAGTKFLELGSTGLQEYIILEYANSDKLYVPIDQIDRISYYSSKEASVPRLVRLGSGEWEKTKARAKESAQNLAEELLSIYSKRDSVSGYAFAPDSPWQGQLEDSFPYFETTDQMNAINAVKSDMENRRPMDRLVCGDVGYGKTEVALRAAFKAVVDGKQVAILVPTTVLAEQHHQTFLNRLKPFPVNVEVLSRLRSKVEQSKVLKNLREGSVDILIGTHRLLQKDVVFKDLGLVVIDEEQRFGVVHKDRFKKMRSEVDVLTMTATPIPRTLYISLAGIRDISKMETPPEDRLSVKTYVVEFEESLVREAILKETDRGGQVFYLHNRVADIEKVLRFLHNLVPHCRIGIAHGRLHESDLSSIVNKFRDGKIDVLLCTTIIESGLHIDNANTLIVDNADRFGLGQLYQLRGGVGRGSTRGYAYFMLPNHTDITLNSRKRLQTILAASDIGSGFYIAMRDLEIRGAGNILGAEQSGHLHAVGFDLYTKLVAEAVEKLKEGPEAIQSDAMLENGIRISLNLDAFIPIDYVSDLTTRLELYQQVCLIKDDTEIVHLESEFIDRFGPLVPEVEGLFYVLRLKMECKNSGIVSIVSRETNITIELAQSLGGGREALKKLLGEGVDIGDRRIHIKSCTFDKNWDQNLLVVVDTIKTFNNKMTILMDS